MHPDRPATLLTVAKAAGVSKTTASDALRGSGRVSAETRAAVQRVAEELGYVPNGSARHLRRASTGTIGLYVPEVVTRSDYYMAFVFGVVEKAAGNDYDITLITSGHGRGRTRRPRVDGLVVGDPLAGDPVVDQLMAAGLPTVTCEHLPGTGRPDGVVWSRHADVIAELLDHLRAAGAARPALIVAGDESDWAASVHRGYNAWCARHGASPMVATVPFEAPHQTVHAAGRDLLHAHPDLDALVCAPAGSAATLLPLLHAAGRRVGHDILLASGVDGPNLRLTDPPVTAIDLRPRQAGAACAELLFDLLSGASPPGSERIHPIELIVRASTNPN